MSRKNQVIIVSPTDTIRRQLVSRIKTDGDKITGKWNNRPVVFVENNIWTTQEA